MKSVNSVAGKSLPNTKAHFLTLWCQRTDHFEKNYIVYLSKKSYFTFYGLPNNLRLWSAMYNLLM